MVKPILVLLAVGLIGLSVVLLLPQSFDVVAAILGLAITLPPALISMLAVVIVSRRQPQLGVTVVLAGTGLRMGWALVVVAALGNKAEQWQTTPTALAAGTTAFYIMLLVTETILLWGLLNGGNARHPE